jgi:hypothetical protein
MQVNIKEWVDLPTVKLVTRHITTSVATAAEFWVAAYVVRHIWTADPTVLVWLTGIEDVVIVGIFGLLGVHLLQATVKLLWGKGHAGGLALASV